MSGTDLQVEASCATQKALVFRGNSKQHFKKRLNDQNVQAFLGSQQIHSFLAIDFSYNELTDAAAACLAELVGNCRDLVSLNLQGNHLQDPGAVEILEAAKSPGLKYVNLAHNKLGDQTVFCLVASLRRSRALEELNLAGNQVSQQGLISLADFLQGNTSSLQILNLDRPAVEEMDNVMGTHYGKMLRGNNRLQRLAVQKNRINCSCIYTISEYLMDNATLKVLDLSANLIAFRGSQAIAKYLTSAVCSLESLIMASNKAGDAGARELACGLSENQTLKHLDLRSNGIAGKGLKFIADAAYAHKTIQSIALQGNLFDQQANEAFEKLLKRTDAKVKLDFLLYWEDEDLKMAYADMAADEQMSVCNWYYL